MQYEKAYSFLIQKLETGLPAYLAYHNTQHTLQVIENAEKLANEEGIESGDLVLLKTAALFHDAGFLQHHQEHEDLSCKIARRHLPDFDYSPEQVEAICAMIMATRLPQTPVDKLGQLLCDADLYYLGTDQYNIEADKLYSEFKKAGIVKTHTEWELRQVEFLSAHHFFTNAARLKLEEGKQVTLERLKVKLQQTISGRHNKSFEVFQDLLLTICGVAISATALKLFLVPNRFFDGGITGISLLIHENNHYNLGLIIFLLNMPLVITSYFSVGKKFALRMLFSVTLLGMALLLIPDYPITADKLLISLFGGVFLGIGIGLVMRAGAALDGIEVLALYTLKRTSFSIAEIIMGINIIIFSIAAFQFGIETALYSILTYFAATRSIDYVVEGLQAYTGVTIVSAKSEFIKYQLVNKLGRGITVYKGERGFLPGRYDVSNECDIIFTVITRLELRRLKNLVYEVDPEAFVFANTIREASGGVLKRRQHH
jgi:uncharacterized membrane-anchored protein YitT (DUF2179 family)/HD superfamily phosphodiesterase